MERENHESFKTRESQAPEPNARRKDEKRAAQLYRAPHLYVIGKAIDLVQGSPSGKYSDGYTGYYWER